MLRNQTVCLSFILPSFSTAFIYTMISKYHKMEDLLRLALPREVSTQSSQLKSLTLALQTRLCFLVNFPLNVILCIYVCLTKLSELFKWTVIDAMLNIEG